MSNRIVWGYIGLTAITLAFMLLFMRGGFAQHNHPPQDEALHEKFYSTWYMPDEPTKSCCNKADCYPTIARFQNGSWYARRREDAKWLKVPWSKVERNRDNPDGQSHMCAPPPTATAYPADTVFCFSLGGGT